MQTLFLLDSRFRGNDNRTVNTYITFFGWLVILMLPATWLDQVTELGPTLDSWADFAIYVSFFLCAWWLWPEIVLREQVCLGIIVVCIVLPAVIGLIRFRRGTSHHSCLVKLAVVCTAPSVLLVFLGGPAWPLHIATIICVLAAAEEIAITLLMDKPQSDVKSLIHIITDRARVN